VKEQHEESFQLLKTACGAGIAVHLAIACNDIPFGCRAGLKNNHPQRSDNGMSKLFWYIELNSCMFLLAFETGTLQDFIIIVT
jgi:hypothetical protein